MKKKTNSEKSKFYSTLRKFNKFRIFSLSIAESFDAWRIIPRLMLIAYSALVLNMYVWYKSIPTYVQEKCDAAVIEIFMQHGSNLEQAQQAACSVQNVVGGPTSSQTALVTTIVGLSTLIFGFYTNSGRKWEGGLPDDVMKHHDDPPPQPFPPQPTPYQPPQPFPPPPPLPPPP